MWDDENELGFVARRCVGEFSSHLNRSPKEPRAIGLVSLQGSDVGGCTCSLGIRFRIERVWRSGRKARERNRSPKETVLLVPQHVWDEACALAAFQRGDVLIMHESDDVVRVSRRASLGDLRHRARHDSQTAMRFGRECIFKQCLIRFQPGESATENPLEVQILIWSDEPLHIAGPV